MITKKPEAIEKKQSFTTEQIQENLLALQKYDVTDSKQINQLRIEESERLKNSYIQSTKVSDSLRTEVYKHLSDLKDVTVIGTESPHQMKLGEKSSWEMEQKNKYPIQTTIQRIKKEKETSITENLSDLDRESTTFMILNTFIKGYATTKNGMILQNQNENKEFDSGFIKAYLSDNKEERNVYLQQFTDEFLEYEMSENIFDDTYLKYHADELVRMYEKLSCFPILMKENPEFFNNLDDVTKQLIKIRLENMQYEYCSVLKYRMGANGIRIDDGKEISDTSVIDTYRQADLQAREGFKNNLAHTEELQQALFIESFEERVKNNIETNINLEEVEDLKNVRELFSNYPEQYANHKDFFENVYQKYYRITDSLSYVYAEEQAHKNVWNDYKNENNHGHRILSNLIENRLTNMHVKKLIMQKNLEDFKELIHYVIGHTPILTNGAKSIAEQENLIDEVKIIQDERFEFILENESVDMSELEPIAKINKKINEKLKKDAFRYGIPQLQAMRHIIQEQANVSLTEVDKMLSKGNGRLLCKQSEHYFNILSKENISGKLTELYQTHKEFVNTCQSMSENYKKAIR